MKSACENYMEEVILTTGLVCLDIVSICQDFPIEDSDQRVVDQTWKRGGNASNTATVLAALGSNVEYCGTIANTHEQHFIVEDLKSCGIAIDRCVYKSGCATPLSICIVNQKNGSRTILHSNKSLPELTCEEFKKIQLNKYKWIHFEGRPSVNEIRGMLQYIDEYNQSSQHHKIITSVEFEKKRDFSAIHNYADYVFVSKEHAQYNGLKNKEEAIQYFCQRIKQGGSVICAWSEDGAVGQTMGGSVVSSAIFPPEKVVDTLGAGDSFNAATIHALAHGHSLHEAITYGCKIAGAKCGINGLKNIPTLDIDKIN